MTDIRELKELINSRFEQLDKKIEVGFAEVKGEIKRLDERINGVETRLDSVDKRLDSVDKRLDSVDKRLERLETSQKNQIWALIGILGTALLGLTSKILFFPGNL